MDSTQTLKRDLTKSFVWYGRLSVDVHARVPHHRVPEDSSGTKSENIFRDLLMMTADCRVSEEPRQPIPENFPTDSSQLCS